MKLFKFTAAALAVFALASCGGASNKVEEVKQLKDINGEWTADQTDEAIDIYIKGVEEQTKFLETEGLIMDKVSLGSYIQRKGNKDVIEKRKDDMLKAEQALEEEEKALKEKYKED